MRMTRPIGGHSLPLYQAYDQLTSETSLPKMPGEDLTSICRKIKFRKGACQDLQWS